MRNRVYLLYEICLYLIKNNDCKIDSLLWLATATRYADFQFLFFQDFTNKT